MDAVCILQEMLNTHFVSQWTGKGGQEPRVAATCIPCQGPGRAVLYRLWNYDSASPKEPFKTRDIIWISGWRSKKPIYFCGLFRQSMLSRIPYNFAVVGKYFFVDALNGKSSLHVHCYATEYYSWHKLQLLFKMLRLYTQNVIRNSK